MIGDILLERCKVLCLFRRMMVMERSPFLPLPEGMVIGQVEITQTQLTVEVISTQPYAHCPGCGNSSDAVHCQYRRKQFTTFPVEGAASCCNSVCASFFAGQPPARGRCLPSGFPT